jgi:hypothetical protein
MKKTQGILKFQSKGCHDSIDSIRMNETDDEGDKYLNAEILET